MSNIAVQQQGVVIQQTEDELIQVLQNSLYPGANMSAVRMVLGYCQASGLDPMQKPVHIVPMWDKQSRSMRDVVMPGISLYRTQAARTGEHVGTDEPVYGPMVELQLGGMTFTVPEWCKVTVWRMKGGMRCAFVATEYWIENYATAGKDSDAPNTMWKKRSRGQIAKCAEAQALRKGFPEVGSAPTAEEMEGKSMGGEVDITPEAAQPKQVTGPALIDCTVEHFDKNKSAWREVIVSKRKTPAQLIAMLGTKLILSQDQQLTIASWLHEIEEASDTDDIKTTEDENANS